MPDLIAAGRITATQVMAVEVSAIGIVAAVFALPPAFGLLTGSAAVALLFLAVGRVGGRWGYEAVGARLRLRRRRRLARQAARAADPDSAELAALAPYLRITGAVDLSGAATGIGEDESGWFAGVEVSTFDGLSQPPLGRLHLDALAGLFTEGSLTATTIQLVVRQTSLPTTAIAADSPCAVSYQELHDFLSVPPQRDVWIAVRLGLRDGAAVAAERGGDVAAVHKSLAASLARVGAALTAAGLQHRVLDSDDLRDALRTALGADPVAYARGRIGSGAESWSRWQSAAATHVSFAVRDLPTSPSPELVSELIRVPKSTSVNVGIVLGPTKPTDGGTAPIATLMVIRVAATPGALGGCTRHLRSVCRRAGVKLVRLDGEQASGVYATAPTGSTIGLTPW